MSYSERFKEAMAQIATRMPAAEIAKRSGLHRSTVYQWLGGNAPRDSRSIVDFGESLGLPDDMQQSLLRAAGFPVVEREEHAPEEFRVTSETIQELRGALVTAARSYWLEERRHALPLLDHLMACYFEADRKYVRWCASREVEPGIPDWKIALSLALSRAEESEIETAIAASFELLCARAQARRGDTQRRPMAQPRRRHDREDKDRSTGGVDPAAEDPSV